MKENDKLMSDCFLTWTAILEEESMKKNGEVRKLKSV
jgi:hypothetical protein